MILAAVAAGVLTDASPIHCSLRSYCRSRFGASPRLVVRPETRLDALLNSEAFEALTYNLNFHLDLQLETADVIGAETVQGLINHVTTQREEKYA